MAIPIALAMLTGSAANAIARLLISFQLKGITLNSYFICNKAIAVSIRRFQIPKLITVLI
jgi:hypothetical protein